MVGSAEKGYANCMFFDQRDIGFRTRSREVQGAFSDQTAKAVNNKDDLAIFLEHVSIALSM